MAQAVGISDRAMGSGLCIGAMLDAIPELMKNAKDGTVRCLYLGCRSVSVYTDSSLATAQILKFAKEMASCFDYMEGIDGLSELGKSLGTGLNVCAVPKLAGDLSGMVVNLYKKGDLGKLGKEEVFALVDTISTLFSVVVLFNPSMIYLTLLAKVLDVTYYSYKATDAWSNIELNKEGAALDNTKNSLKGEKALISVVLGVASLVQKIYGVSYLSVLATLVLGTTAASSSVLAGLISGYQKVLKDEAKEAKEAKEAEEALKKAQQQQHQDQDQRASIEGAAT